MQDGEQLVEEILSRLKEATENLAKLKKQIEGFSETETVHRYLFEFFERMPYPAWIKRYDRRTGSFKLLTINEAYTTQFGVKPEYHQGRYDSEVWPAELAAQFYDENMRALTLGVIEIDNTLTDTNNIVSRWVGRKWSLTLWPGEIGVAGILRRAEED